MGKEGGRLREDLDEEERVKRHTDLLPQKVDLVCQEVRTLLLLEVDERRTESSDRKQSE